MPLVVLVHRSLKREHSIHYEIPNQSRSSLLLFNHLHVLACNPLVSLCRVEPEVAVVAHPKTGRWHAFPRWHVRNSWFSDDPITEAEFKDVWSFARMEPPEKELTDPARKFQAMLGFQAEGAENPRDVPCLFYSRPTSDVPREPVEDGPIPTVPILRAECAFLLENDAGAILRAGDAGAILRAGGQAGGQDGVATVEPVPSWLMVLWGRKGCGVIPGRVSDAMFRGVTISTITSSLDKLNVCVKSVVDVVCRVRHSHRKSGRSRQGLHGRVTHQPSPPSNQSIFPTFSNYQLPAVLRKSSRQEPQ